MFLNLVPQADLLIIIHFYSCLRLPALIWSLPHFRVQVVMFSALGFLSLKCLVNSTWGGEMNLLSHSL